MEGPSREGSFLVGGSFTDGSSPRARRRSRILAKSSTAGLSPRHEGVVRAMRAVRDHPRFNNVLIGAILLAGVVVGVNSYSSRDRPFTVAMYIVDEMVVGSFIAEFLIKVLAEGRYPLRYFADTWNVMDFVIVAVGLVPTAGPASVVLRLVRLLRVLKLVRAIPELRVLVVGLITSVSSIGYIVLLLLLLFYLYAVVGVTLFAQNDPWHFGSLHVAMVTLWRLSTLEDHTDVLYIAIDGCENYGYDDFRHLCTHNTTFPYVGPVYFVSFVVLSSMLVLNLFVGVVTASMADARRTVAAEGNQLAAMLEKTEDEVVELRLEQMVESMQKIADELQHFAHVEKERSISMGISMPASTISQPVESFVSVRE